MGRVYFIGVASGGTCHFPKKDVAWTRWIFTAQLIMSRVQTPLWIAAMLYTLGQWPRLADTFSFVGGLELAGCSLVRHPRRGLVLDRVKSLLVVCLMLPLFSGATSLDAASSDVDADGFRRKSGKGILLQLLPKTDSNPDGSLFIDWLIESTTCNYTSGYVTFDIVFWM